MLQTFSVALFLYSKNRSYGKLLVLANAIHDGLTSTSGIFTAPVPSLPTLATQISKMQSGMSRWNNGAGSKSDLEDLRAAVKRLRASLKQLGRYVMTTAPDNTQAWTDAGFQVKSARSATVALNKVENLRRLLSATNLPLGAIRIRWNRPLDSEGKRISSYRVLRGSSPDPSHAVEIAIVTASAYVDTPPAGQVSYYFVIAYNAAGPGATSDMLRVAMPAI